MNATATTSTYNPALAGLLNILALLLVVAVLTGLKLPLISSYRAGLVALIVIGMAACTMGGLGRVAAAGAWAHPLSILGYLIGALILVIAGAALFGKQLPLISGDRAVFIAVAVLIGSKWALSLVHRLVG
jgi:hypothetical protein